jgi:hypothetical protein
MKGAVADICTNLNREAPGSHEKKKGKSKLTPEDANEYFQVC